MKAQNPFISISKLLKRSRRNTLLAISLCTSIVFMSNGCLPLEAIHTNTDLFSEASAPISAVGGQKFTCDSPALRGMTEGKMRRLTRLEVESTLRDIFGDEVIDANSGSLGLYSSEGSDVSRFRDVHSNLAVRAIYNVAKGISELAVSRSDYTSRIAPGCLFSNSNNTPNFSLSNNSCRKGFISNLGLKILRRPLSTAEVNGLNDVLKSNNEMFGNDSERVSYVIQSLIMRPDFVFHMSRTVGSGGSKRKVDQYTIASRLSYRLTGSLPDAALFAAAEAGQLDSTQKMWPHAARLLDSPRGRTFVRNVFERWLELDKVPNPKQVYLDHLNVSSNNIVNDLKKEALDFAEYIVFEQRGSFADLLESKAAFPPSDAVAKIMKTDVSNGIGDPSFTNDGRSGLYMRPALFVSPESRTSPIHRGYHFLTQFMCKSVPAPSAEDIAEGNNLASQIDPLMVSSRREAEHITSSSNCTACHSVINPPGFVFENFGPVGDLRTQEPVFDANGNYLRNLPVETAVADMIIDGVKRDIRSPANFSKDMSASFEAKSCYAQQVFRFTRFAFEEKADNCQLADVEASLNLGRSLFDTFIRSAATEDIMWERKR